MATKYSLFSNHHSVVVWFVVFSSPLYVYDQKLIKIRTILIAKSSIFVRFEREVRGSFPSSNLVCIVFAPKGSSVDIGYDSSMIVIQNSFTKFK